MKEKKLPHFTAAALQTGDFLENAAKVKYSVEVKEDHVILTELDINGEIVKDAKKRKITNELLDGLFRTRHFFKAKNGKRTSYGDLESRLEFNKLVPK